MIINIPDVIFNSGLKPIYAGLISFFALWGFGWWLFFLIRLLRGDSK